jgi:hypothetical protein
LNISTPVHTVLRVGRIPTISTVSPTLTTPLDPSGGHRAPSLDPEHIFNRHQEGLIHRARGVGIEVSTAFISSMMLCTPTRPLPAL